MEKELEELKKSISEKDNQISKLSDDKKSYLNRIKELEAQLNGYEVKDIDISLENALSKNNIEAKHNDAIKTLINGYYGKYTKENIEKFFKEKDYSVFVKNDINNPLDNNGGENKEKQNPGNKNSVKKGYFRVEKPI